MTKPLFTGLCTALVTPFLDGDVNYPMLEVLIRRQMDAGVEAIVLAGTTGESPTLTAEEKLEIFRVGVKTAGGRCRIIAGTGSNSTSSAVEMSRAAARTGVDALLVVTPYYNKTTQTGLVKHYRAICDAVSIPVMGYNVPSRTGMGIDPATCRELARIPNFAGIKEASGDLSRAMRMMEHLPLWSGNDDQVVPMMSLGAKGVISVASNIVPEVMVKMSHLCLENDFEAASKLQIEYMDLIDALFCEVNPIPVKAAMNLMGMEAGSLRLPLCDISEKNLAVLRASMERMNLL